MTASKAIVLIEDDEGHAVLFMKLLRRRGVNHPFQHFVTGASAWTFFDTQTAPGETLQLIVLDINLPDTTGIEILTRLSAHPTLQAVPVVMLSSSDDLDDVRTSLELGALHYVTKPVLAHPFCDICSDIGCPLSLKPLAGSDSVHGQPADDREPWA